MKIFIIFVFILVLPFVSNADCVKNSYGEIVCGAGQCALDQYGKAFCAGAGGGAMKDGSGVVQCGVGYCDRDSYNKIWCSKQAGGGAMTDSYGKVVCMDGCEEGSTSLCK